MEVQRAITNYIRREILFNGKHIPELDQPLLSSAGGALDSVGLQQLIAFIEQHFNIEVGDLDIVPENFETLDAVVSYVQAKRS